jgi:hypothetical protein
MISATFHVAMTIAQTTLLIKTLLETALAPQANCDLTTHDA